MALSIADRWTWTPGTLPKIRDKQENRTGRRWRGRKSSSCPTPIRPAKPTPRPSRGFWRPSIPGPWSRSSGLRTSGGLAAPVPEGGDIEELLADGIPADWTVEDRRAELEGWADAPPAEELDAAAEVRPEEEPSFGAVRPVRPWSRALGSWHHRTAWAASRRTSRTRLVFISSPRRAKRRPSPCRSRSWPTRTAPRWGRPPGDPANESWPPLRRDESPQSPPFPVRSFPRRSGCSAAPWPRRS